MTKPGTPEPIGQPPVAPGGHATLLLWLGVALLPVFAGVVMGAVHAGHRCNIENDDTAIRILGLEFLLLPAAVLTLGVVAGSETWRPRGRGWAVLGAFAGAFLGLVWGFLAYWGTLLTITEVAC